MRGLYNDTIMYNVVAESLSANLMASYRKIGRRLKVAASRRALQREVLGSRNRQPKHAGETSSCALRLLRAQRTMPRMPCPAVDGQREVRRAYSVADLLLLYCIV